MVAAPLVAALIALVGGCAADPEGTSARRAVTTSQDHFAMNRDLTDADAKEVLAAMRSTAPPGEGPALTAAKYGVRWSDVPSAARWGSDVAEMAILRKNCSRTDPSRHDACAQWTFQLITVADEPVTMIVNREAPPKVYSLQISAGLFGNRTDLVERLKTQFDLAMIEYGKRLRPQDADEE